jgi:hypothetical protein
MQEQLRQRPLPVGAEKKIEKHRNARVAINASIVADKTSLRRLT